MGADTVALSIQLEKEPMTPRNWHQFEIQDERLLSGPSLTDLVSLLAHVLPTRFVVVGRAEGGGPNFRRTFGSESFIEFALADFMDAAQGVVQFDWGDFFLVEKKGEFGDLSPATPYSVLVDRATATVRAVDDTYFYVYTSEDRAAKEIMAAYAAASHKLVSIGRLDFPD